MRRSTQFVIGIVGIAFLTCMVVFIRSSPNKNTATPSLLLELVVTPKPLPSPTSTTCTDSFYIYPASLAARDYVVNLVRVEVQIDALIENRADTSAQKKLVIALHQLDVLHGSMYILAPIETSDCKALHAIWQNSYSAIEAALEPCEKMNDDAMWARCQQLITTAHNEWKAYIDESKR